MRTKEQVKIRAFDKLFPGIEPQDLGYQTRVRAEGHMLVNIARTMDYGQIEHAEMPLTQTKGTELLSTRLDELMQKYTKDKSLSGSLDVSRLEGEINALLWFFEREWCNDCRWSKPKKCAKCGGKRYV